MKTKIIFCCFLGLISCNVTLAQGYDFYGPWGCGWGYYNQPYVYSYEYVPYYALHPPVYYSYRIDARSYGDSPFPYPPGLSALQAYSSVQPQIIKNEHIDEAVLRQTSTKLMRHCVFPTLTLSNRAMRACQKAQNGKTKKRRNPW